jgi:exonuclease III
VVGETQGVLVTHTKVAGSHYVIANCYVPNYGYGDGKAKREFIKNSAEVFSRILDKGGVTVFAGDFNAVLSTSHCKRKGLPGSFPEEVEWINEITKTNGLSCGKVTAEVTGPKGEFYTYYSFRGRKQTPAPGSLLGSIRIDHVFVSENAEVETIVDNTVVLRDHFPLISVVTPKVVTPKELPL